MSNSKSKFCTITLRPCSFAKFNWTLICFHGAKVSLSIDEFPWRSCLSILCSESLPALEWTWLLSNIIKFSALLHFFMRFICITVKKNIFSILTMMLLLLNTKKKNQQQKHWFHYIYPLKLNDEKSVHSLAEWERSGQITYVYLPCQHSLIHVHKK